MMDFQIIMSSLEEAYLNALQESFAIYFASNFPEVNQDSKITGCLQNIEEITKDYETMRKALQQQNLQLLQRLR